MKRFIYSLILSVCFISCGSIENKKESTSLIHIKIENLDMSSLQPLKLSEFVDSIEYLQLEATSECLLPYYGAKYTFRVDNSLFLGDLHSILRFDATTGKFIGEIGKRGEGPEEYVQIENMCIDKDNSRIIIKDGGSRQKLLAYNYEGYYLGQIIFNNTEESLFTSCFYTLNLKDIDSQYMIFIANMMTIDQACQPNELIVYDYKNKKILYTSPNLMSGKYKRNASSGNGVRVSTRYDGKIYHKSFNNDTLYSIDKEKGIDPFAVIDLGDKKLPDEFFLSRDPRSILIGKILINEIYINQDCILLECFTTKESGIYDSFICKYDITSEKSTYHQSYLINDIDGGSNAYSKQLSEKMGYIYPSDELDGKDPKICFSTLDKSELKYPELKERFELIQKNRKTDDNPLLMMLHLKKKNNMVTNKIDYYFYFKDSFLTLQKKGQTPSSKNH